MEENKEFEAAGAEAAEETVAEEVPAEHEETVEEKKDDPSEELRGKIEELEAKLREQEDKYLRMAAEYENFRRRSREERAAAYDDAVSDTVSELLPIIDNLERAAAFDDGEKVKEGLVLTAKTVSGVLEKLKIETVGAPGDIFDPNLHNAVLHDEDPERAEGEITDVFQKGYKKGNKIIRFAMVKTVN